MYVSYISQPASRSFSFRLLHVVYASEAPVEEISSSSTSYTVSFEIPAIFDLDAIPYEDGEPLQVTIVSGDQQITITLLAIAAVSTSLYPQRPDDIPFPNLVWESVNNNNPHRPLGSVHDFGVFAFGNMIVNGPGSGSAMYGAMGVEHMEGGGPFAETLK